MRYILSLIVLFAVTSLSAQVKTNVTTTSKSILEVSTVKVDSVDLERFNRENNKGYTMIGIIAKGIKTQ